MESNLVFFNRCFDKGRLKTLISWFLIYYGEKATIELVENLKELGFKYATQAGISLSLDDLQIPPTKALVVSEAELVIQKTEIDYKKGHVTAVENFQKLIDTWHRASEILKQNVIQHFKSTNILNPVYMMAFSGARGNISQVRQLVGMRGLMADPQGQIINFPIKSNFREGLTLTEYVISCYGARKGLVDTALRTANSGYLTRRLVDVSQHIIISQLDCGTTKGVVLSDMKEGQKIVLSLQNRLVGRTLAENIEFHFDNSYSFGSFLTCPSSGQEGRTRKDKNLPLDPKKQSLKKKIFFKYLLDHQKNSRFFFNYLRSTEIFLSLSKRTYLSKKKDRIFYTLVPLIYFFQKIQKKFLFEELERQEGQEGQERQERQERVNQLNKQKFKEKKNIFFIPVQRKFREERIYPFFGKDKYDGMFFSEILVEKIILSEKKIFNFDQSFKQRLPKTLNQRLTFNNRFYFEHKQVTSRFEHKNKKKSFFIFRNQQISTDLAFKISKIKKKVLVRSPLTCEAKNSICQLCYGWSLANGNLVSLGEAVGILAAQSIGEPGTQLTMRTFHTGGVFSGDIMHEIRSPYNGIIEFPEILQGTLIRTPHGKIAFLTKNMGELIIRENCDNFFFRTQIPAATILFVRHGEKVLENQVIAEFSSMSADLNQRIQAKHNLKSEKEGQIFFDDVLLTVKFAKNGDVTRTAKKVGSFWILSGKIYQSTIPSFFIPKVGDVINEKSILNQSHSFLPSNGFLETKFTSYFVSRGSKKKSLKNTFNSTKDIFFKNSILTLSIKNIRYHQYGYFFSIWNNMFTHFFNEFNNLKFNQVFSKNERFFLSNSIKQEFENRNQLKNSFYYQWFPNKYKTLTGGKIYFNKNYWNKANNDGQFYWLPEENYKFNAKNLKLINQNGYFNLKRKKKNLSPNLLSLSYPFCPSSGQEGKEGQENLKGNIGTSPPFIFQFTNDKKISGPSSGQEGQEGKKRQEKKFLHEKSSHLVFPSLHKKIWFEKKIFNFLQSNLQDKLLAYSSFPLVYSGWCKISQNLPNTIKKKLIKEISLIDTSLKKRYKEEKFSINNVKKIKIKKTNFCYKNPCSLGSTIQINKLLVKNLEGQERQEKVKNYFSFATTNTKFFFLSNSKELRLSNFGQKKVLKELPFIAFQNIFTYLIIPVLASSPLGDKNKDRNRRNWRKDKEDLLSSKFWKTRFGSHGKINKIVQKKENNNYRKLFFLQKLLNTSSTKLNVKPGWIYFPQNVCSIQRDSKTYHSFSEFGSNNFDDFIFDQHLVSFDTILLNKHQNLENSFCSKKRLDSKILFLKKNSNFSKILKTTGISLNTFYNFGQQKLQDTFFEKKKSHNGNVKNPIRKKNGVSCNLDFLMKSQFEQNQKEKLVSCKKTIKLQDFLKIFSLGSQNIFNNFLEKFSYEYFLTIGIQPPYRFSKIYFISNSKTRFVKNNCFLNAKSLLCSTVFDYTKNTKNVKFFQDTLQNKEKHNEIFNLYFEKKIFSRLFLLTKFLYETLENDSQPVIKILSKLSEKPIDSGKKTFSAFRENHFWPFQLILKPLGFDPKDRGFLLVSKKAEKIFKIPKKKYYSWYKFGSNPSSIQTCFPSTITRNLMKPKFFVVIRKAYEYSLIDSLHYKKLFFQANQPLLHSLANYSLVVPSHILGFSWFNKQKKTPIILTFPAPDIKITSNYSFLIPKKDGENSSIISFLRESNLVNIFISFCIPQTFPLKKSQIRLFSQKVVLGNNLAVILSGFSSYYLQNGNTSILSRLKLAYNGLLSTKKLFYSAKFSSSPLPLIPYKEKWEKKQKHAKQLSNTKQLKSFPKESLFLANKNAKKEKNSSFSQFQLSSFYKSFHIKKILTNKNVSFNNCVDFSFFRKLDFSTFLISELKTKNNGLRNTKLSLFSQNWVSRSKALSFTSFLSPYEGEVAILKDEKENVSKSLEKIDGIDGRQSCFILMPKDQKSFLLEQNSKPLAKNYVGKLIRYGEKICSSTNKEGEASNISGQIIQIDKLKIVLRKATPVLFSSGGVFHVYHGDFIEKNAPLLTLYYQRIKTGDIVQGIPKIEQFFEARQTQEGEVLPENLHEKLQEFFNINKQTQNSQEAARKSLEKIQKILVDGVQKVYQSQGVTIADKHLELIVRQMTSKVRILQGGQTGLLRGELIDLNWIEIVNRGLNFQKAEYEPIILGITKASLETESFISAASFQETTRILARAAIERKTDFLRGLKENVILGHLIPAGTGFSLSFEPEEKKSFEFSQKNKIEITG